MRGATGMRLTWRERLAGLLFITPATLIIAVFLIWPTLNMFLISVWPPEGGDFFEREWVGLRNYQDVLTDRQFQFSLRNTALFTLGVVPIQTAAALLFAVWVNGPGASRRFLRICLFVPTTISLAVLAVVWALIYAPETATRVGLLNAFLQPLGLGPVPFLTDARLALWSLVFMSIWQGLGLQMMIFLSGLQQIPAQLYEAAELDGATARRQFLSITLPGVAPTATFVVMITTIFALRLFVQPYVMTEGGPNYSTLSVVQFVYAAFSDNDLQLACAAAVVFFVGVFVITMVQRYTLAFSERLTE